MVVDEERMRLGHWFCALTLLVIWLIVIIIIILLLLLLGSRSQFFIPAVVRADSTFQHDFTP